MLFNSREFIVFFPIVVALFFALPHRFRWALLLLASYFFYMSWRAEYGLLLLAVTVVTYGAGVGIESARTDRARKFYLGMGIAAGLAPLLYYKYANFVTENVGSLANFVGASLAVPEVGILLPVGISFYTFQALSYTIDVYRGHSPTERHFGIYALYVSFFPQLIAGPIERSTRLLPQFRRVVSFNAERCASGLRLMLWGLFKKMVIADNAALLVDPVYANPEQFSGFAIAIATIFFAVQIYCDFSGYADMAVGAARILGVRLMRNFDRPYGAFSIGDFWHRWHISLSTWMRDYLYIPLGGKRVALPRHIANLLIVFVISGLWHGAAWHFVIWGAIHGALLAFSVLTQNWRRKAAAVVRLDRVPAFHRAIQIALTLVLVNFAWIFFRAESLGDAVLMTGRIFTDFGSLTTDLEILFPFASEATITVEGIAALSVASVILFAAHMFSRPVAAYRAILNLPVVVRWSGYYGVILAVLFLGPPDAIEFIYFQF